MISDSKNSIQETALIRAREYCSQNGLSLNKLSKQIYAQLGDFAYFFQEMPYYGGGLKEDLASQPRPTLEYDLKKGTIAPTQYTELFLK